MSNDNKQPIDLFGDDDIPVVGVTHSTPTTSLATNTQSKKPPAPQPRKKKPTPTMFEDPELRAIAKKKPEPDPIAWKDLVTKIIHESGLAFSTPESQQRCVSAAETFVRGVRDHDTTKMRLMQPLENGGAGLTHYDAHVCVQALAKAFESQRYQEFAKSKIAKSAFVTKNIDRLTKSSLAHIEEDRVLDSRYRALTKNLQTEHSDLHPMRMESHDVMKKIETRLAVPAKAIRVQSQGPTSPIKKLIANTTVKPALSDTAIPTPVKPKTLVSDIRTAPRLIGPIQELEGMTIEDFRKISRHPKEAVRRIQEKIDNLNAQGHVFKRRGVEAWKNSPVGKIYYTMLRETILGTSLDTIIASRQEAHQPTLTKDEFSALMDFNQSMRFV